MITGTLEDREELRELYARYCHSIDSGRYDEWVDCFTEDGVFESPRFGRCAGREGLLQFCKQHRESLGGAHVLHIVANLSFDIQGDTGTGTCHLVYNHCKDGRIQQSAVGHYTDLLKKTAKGWRFKSRHVNLCGHT